MAGFGRTGKWFACDNWDVVPDILTVAKGINSGYVPLGAMIVSEPVAEALRDRFLAGGLTYSGHPLACASAVASIEAFQEEGIVENAADHGTYLAEALPALAAKHPSIGDVRGLGLFWGLELVKNRETKEMLVPFNAGGEAAAGRACRKRARVGSLSDDPLERRDDLPAADDHARGARRGPGHPRRRARDRRRIRRLAGAGAFADAGELAEQLRKLLHLGLVQRALEERAQTLRVIDADTLERADPFDGELRPRDAGVVGALTFSIMPPPASPSSSPSHPKARASAARRGRCGAVGFVRPAEVQQRLEVVDRHPRGLAPRTRAPGAGPCAPASDGRTDRLRPVPQLLACAILDYSRFVLYIGCVLKYRPRTKGEQ